MTRRNDTGGIQVLTRSIEGAECISVTGEVDMATAPVLNEQITRCIARKPTVLVIDLTRVTFLGSSGLALLVEAHEHAEVRVVANSRATLRPLRITTLDRVLTVYQSMRSAVADILVS